MKGEYDNVAVIKAHSPEPPDSQSKYSGLSPIIINTPSFMY